MLLNGLSRYPCHIINEVGYCKLNRQETFMLSQFIDRIGVKENESTVLTSNKDPSH